MALITCPECGQQISDQATTCIHCGYPLQKATTNKITITNATNRTQQFSSLAPMYLFSIKDDMVSIECGNCSKVYSFSKKYFSGANAKYCIPNADIICPNCKNGVQSGKKIEAKCDNAYVASDKEVIRCPKCKSTLVTTGQRGFSIITGFLGSGKTVNRCGKCGYSWKPR